MREVQETRERESKRERERGGGERKRVGVGGRGERGGKSVCVRIGRVPNKEKR
jgi:hypothetical protein